MSNAVISAVVSAIIALIVGGLSLIATRQQTKIMQQQYNATTSAQAADDKRFDVSLKAEEERFRALQEQAQKQIGVAQAQVEQMELQIVEARRAQKEALQAQRDMRELDMQWKALGPAVKLAAEILWQGLLDETVTHDQAWDIRRKWSALTKQLQLSLQPSRAYDFSHPVDAYVSELMRLARGEITKDEAEHFRLVAANEFSEARGRLFKEDVSAQ